MPSARPNLTGFDHSKFVAAGEKPAVDPWARQYADAFQIVT